MATAPPSQQGQHGQQQGGGGAAGGWSPSHEVLTQTVHLLNVLRDPTNPQFLEAQRHVEAHGGDASLLLSLAYVLAQTTAEQVPDDVRQLAGLLLKNHVVRHAQAFVRGEGVVAQGGGGEGVGTAAELRDYIKHQALVAARDGNQAVRNTAGILITTVATTTLRAGLQLGAAWPDLFPALVDMLGSGQLPAVEGAFSSLLKILEDCGHDVRADATGYGPEWLNRLVGVFPSFFSSPDPRVRAAAVRAMNLLVPLKPAQLSVNMDGFIEALAMLKDDPSPGVRQGVCMALVALFRDGCDHLLARLQEVMEFMLAKSQDPDEGVAREACEFWSVFVDHYGHDEAQRRVPELLRGFLPRLVPVLLAGMVYSAGDREMLVADAKLQLDSLPDRPEDFKPGHHHSRGGRANNGGGGGGGGGREEDEEEDEEEDDDDEDGGGGGGGGGDEVEQWNLRRCSAATLDNLAEFFGPDVVLPVLLPLLYERLQQGEVWAREACILALGAVASCVQGMAKQLPELFPYLLQQLDDKAGLAACPPLGCTVAWTLSRYGRWVLQQENDPAYLSPLVERLLRLTLDHNKKVQQAACSAFATLEEDAGRRLLPYLPHVLQFMAAAMDRYQARSLVVLFDTLGTLADAVRHELAPPEYTTAFMPALWRRWAQFGDQDRVLLYLLECLTSIAQALGVAFQPWAPEVYARCLRLVKQMLLAAQAGQEPDRDFGVCALDLLTGMAEGLGPSFESLVPSHEGELLGLLYGCMRDPCDEVRQSAFALVGDLAKACHHHLAPALPTYMPALVENLDARCLTVCNNASWAIGELTVKVGSDGMAPYVEAIMARLVPLARQYPDMNPHLSENTAITLGRVAKVCPQAVAASPTVGGQLGAFLRAWCLSLQDVKHRGEKEHAFEGLCLLLQQNPAALLAPASADGGGGRGGGGGGGGGSSSSSSSNSSIDTFEAFCWAVASWYDPDRGAPDVPDRLGHMFKVILHYVRDTVKARGMEWDVVLCGLDPQLVQYLVAFYEL